MRLRAKDQDLAIVSITYDGGDTDEEYKVMISKPVCQFSPKDTFYVGGKDELDAWANAKEVINSGEVYEL